MILFVDDNSPLRQSTAEYLRRSGFEVQEAGDGRHAAELLADSATPIRALITDRDLPGLEGIELIDRARTTRPGLPALLITSRPPSGARAEGIEILAKPYDPAVLLAWLHDRTGAPATATRRTSVSAGERGRKPVPAALARAPAPSSPAPDHGRRLAVVLGAFLLSVGLAAGWASLRAPSLPSPPEETTVRGSRIEGLRPSGPLARAPERISWRPVEGAASYLLEITTVDDRLLWQHSLDASPEQATAGVQLAVPPEVRQRCLPNVAYFLAVEARDRSDRVLAGIRGQRFRVVGSGSPDSPADSEPSPNEDSK